MATAAVLRNACAFSTEVLKAVREEAGEDFIIGVCVSVDTANPEVLSLEDQQAIAVLSR